MKVGSNALRPMHMQQLALSGTCLSREGVQLVRGWGDAAAGTIDGEGYAMCSSFQQWLTWENLIHFLSEIMHASLYTVPVLTAWLWAHTDAGCPAVQRRWIFLVSQNNALYTRQQGERSFKLQRLISSKASHWLIGLSGFHLWKYSAHWWVCLHLFMPLRDTFSHCCAFFFCRSSLLNSGSLQCGYCCTKAHSTLESCYQVPCFLKCLTLFFLTHT